MGIALWLSPASPTSSSDLGDLISSLASQHGTPPFGPHVTLLSGIPSSAPLPPLLDSLRAALVQWRTSHAAPLCIDFAELGSKAREGNFFQYLFARVEGAANEPLSALRRAVRGALLPEQSATEDDYFPHLSLMYGVDDEKAGRSAAKIIAQLQRAGGEVRVDGGKCAVRGHEGIEVREVQVWMCEGPPQAWRMVASEAL